MSKVMIKETESVESNLKSDTPTITDQSTMSDFEVTSELYDEQEYLKNSQPTKHDKNVISNFPFIRPPIKNSTVVDEDGDLVIKRKQDNKDVIYIEHSRSTVLELVGLQVWRGSLLLADLVLHLGSLGRLDGTTVLEVGSGVGLTSIAAAMYADHVVCTDIDSGGILDLIKQNVARNSMLIKSQVSVLALNFYEDFSEELTTLLNKVTLVLAADVIYDNDLTDAFIATCGRLLMIPPEKTIYIALEKRYVFTYEDLETVAPCYEHFLSRIKSMIEQESCRSWILSFCPIDFPQRFQYNRIKHLVLWSLSAKLK